jgi:hypothetical protein
MGTVPLVITLLILVAIASQAVAFIITLRIRRKTGEKEDEELDFSSYKDRYDRDKVSPNAQAQPPDG